MQKRFLFVSTLALLGGLALTGCGVGGSVSSEDAQKLLQDMTDSYSAAGYKKPTALTTNQKKTSTGEYVETAIDRSNVYTYIASYTSDTEYSYSWTYLKDGSFYSATNSAKSGTTTKTYSVYDNSVLIGTMTTAITGGFDTVLSSFQSMPATYKSAIAEMSDSAESSEAVTYDLALNSTGAGNLTIAATVTASSDEDYAVGDKNVVTFDGSFITSSVSTTAKDGEITYTISQSAKLNYPDYTKDGWTKSN